jgi:hypothetical protein
MSRFKDRRFKDSSAVHLPLACGAAPTAGATARGRWPAGGAASRDSAAPTADTVAQHPKLAVGAAPTATAAGLHLPEDGSYPKTSTMPTAPQQITSLCSFPLLHRCGFLLCTWDFDIVLLCMDHEWIGFDNTCHVLCCKSCCLFAVICSRMFVSCLFVCFYDPQSQPSLDCDTLSNSISNFPDKLDLHETLVLHWIS